VATAVLAVLWGALTFGSEAVAPYIAQIATWVEVSFGFDVLPGPTGDDDGDEREGA
jgi:hypothetical protein